MMEWLGDKRKKGAETGRRSKHLSDQNSQNLRKKRMEIKCFTNIAVLGAGSKVMGYSSEKSQAFEQSIKLYMLITMEKRADPKHTQRYAIKIITKHRHAMTNTTKNSQFTSRNRLEKQIARESRSNWIH